MSNKYNFNPTPEQLADPKFWASDEVPEGAECFNHETDGYFAHFIKKEDGKQFFLCRHDSEWIQDFCPSLETKIKRPADPNALDKEIVEAFESYDEHNNLELFLTKDKYGYYIATSTAYHFEYFKAGYLAAMEKVK